MLGKLNQLSVVESLNQAIDLCESRHEKEQVQYDIAEEIKAVLNDSIKRCGLDRKVIASEMSTLTGQQISKSIIDHWTRDDNRQRFPIEFVTAFCQVTADQTLIHFINKAMNIKVMTEEERKIVEFVQMKRIRKRADERLEAIEREMKGIL